MKKDTRSKEALVGEAMAVCFENNRVSPYIFQKEIGISLLDSMQIYEELELRGIIVDSKIIDEETNIIGKVNRQKLKKFFKN